MYVCIVSLLDITDLDYLVIKTVLSFPCIF